MLSGGGSGIVLAAFSIKLNLTDIAASFPCFAQNVYSPVSGSCTRSIVTMNLPFASGWSLPSSTSLPCGESSHHHTSSLARKLAPSTNHHGVFGGVASFCDTLNPGGG